MRSKCLLLSYSASKAVTLKLNNTFILFDAGGVSKSHDWKKAHEAIENAVSGMSWPAGSEKGLVIPRIVSVKKGAKYIDKSGKALVWNSLKAHTLRNGVVPLKLLFRNRLRDAGWNSEEPLSLRPYFEKIRANKTLKQVFRYPERPIEAIQDPLHEGVGDFDFWLRSTEGFRTVIEWETGNISSSHRSLNKICLALMGELIDAAVVIVPSNKLNVHLTDRVGNIRELQPYFYFWGAIGRSLRRGLLAVIEVEQDELINSVDERDFIPRGDDGNAFRLASRKIKTPSARKRAKQAP
jgi:Restriction endonuclease BamHI